MTRSRSVNSSRKGVLLSAVTLVERFGHGCRSVNQQNKFLIEIDRRMTPAERRAVIRRWWWFAAPGLSRLLRSRLGQPVGRIFSGDNDLSLELSVNFGRWVRRLAVHEALGKRKSGLSYIRALTTRDYCLYRNAKTRNNHLLVGFPGRSNRLMMPVADFLPALEPLDKDLLLLWTNFPRFAGADNSGRPGTFQESVEAIRAFAVSQGYRHFSVVGTSGGSAPALYCGAAIEADNTVIVGALDPDRPHFPVSWQEISDIWGPRLGDKGTKQPSGLSLTYGATSIQDKEVSEAIAQDIPAEVIEVPGATHSPLWDLVLKGEFSSWLHTVLAEPGPPKRSLFPPESRL
jgi:hypothetical protein